MKKKFRTVSNIFAVYVAPHWLWWDAEQEDEFAPPSWDFNKFCYIDNELYAEEEPYRDSCLLEFTLLGAPIESL